MEIRKATHSDITRIMELIGQAKAYFKEREIDQWQNNYPNPETVKTDIAGGNGYVLITDHRVAATAVISFDGEKTYDVIYNGRWLTDGDYAVVHRIAVDNAYKGRGLASVILKNAEKMCLERSVHAIRADTHKDNQSMQRLLLKNGFKYCGIIYLADKSARMAFEKVF